MKAVLILLMTLGLGLSLAHADDDLFESSICDGSHLDGCFMTTFSLSATTLGATSDITREVLGLDDEEARTVEMARPDAVRHLQNCEKTALLEDAHKILQSKPRLSQVSEQDLSLIIAVIEN